MKKILTVFTVAICCLLFCACNGENKEITAKVGSDPGEIIIGDYIVKIIGNPRYENAGYNQFGHQGHKLCVDIEIENNSKEPVSYNDIDELGLSITANEEGFDCGIMEPDSFDENSFIEPGTSQQMTLYGDNPYYGGGNDGHRGGKNFKINISFGGEHISTKNLSR